MSLNEFQIWGRWQLWRPLGCDHEPRTRTLNISPGRNRSLGWERASEHREKERANDTMRDIGRAFGKFVCLFSASFLHLFHHRFLHAQLVVSRAKAKSIGVIHCFTHNFALPARATSVCNRGHEFLSVECFLRKRRSAAERERER